MNKVIILLLFIPLFHLKSRGQNNYCAFDIKALNSKIGHFEMSKQRQGNKTIYTALTTIRVNLFVRKIHFESTNVVTYKGNILSEAHNKVMVNQQLHSWSDIVRRDSSYSIQLDGKSRPDYDKLIYFSGSKLYFQEPESRSHAFAESSGIFMEIKDLGKGAYELFDPENKRRFVHYYENGELVKVKIKHPLLTIVLEK